MVDHEAMRNAYLRAIGAEEQVSIQFKKPYRGKNGKKFFSPFSLLPFSSILKNVFKKDRLTIVLRSSETSKKIEVIKFTPEETDTIMIAASSMHMTVQELFDYVFKEILTDAKRKTYLREL